MTDDQGRYEVTPLNEGTYFLSAKASPWYAVHPTFERRGCGELARSGGFLTRCSLSRYLLRRRHRGPDGATPIAVHGGDRLEADIHLKSGASTTSDLPRV